MRERERERGVIERITSRKIKVMAKCRQRGYFEKRGRDR